MLPPLSFQRNGQRISILNPIDESPPPSATSTDFPSSEDGLTSPTAPRDHAGKIHQCGVCLKSFTTSGHLTRHARIHTGVKPHVCPYPRCDKDCSRLDNLIQHYRVHLPKEDRGRGNPYIRTCMLDLPVPVVVPASQQANVPIEQCEPPLAFKSEAERSPMTSTRPRVAIRTSCTRDDRTPPSTSMTDSRPPPPSSPSGSSRTATPSGVVTTPSDEDARLLASLRHHRGYPQNESFVRGAYTPRPIADTTRYAKSQGP